ncbi:MAG: DUF433 domain-containing protein [Chloroflexi bacterium]|nr:DUF433 domain-containing protein [Chloroflexota bacterium]
MSDNGNGRNGWRTQPMYTFAEVAHLAQVSVGTVRNWLLGYWTAEGEVKRPLFKGHPGKESACSFLQLIEIVVAAKFRKAERQPFKTVRQAYDNARRIWPNLEYPFASLELKSIGGHIVHIMRVPGVALQAVDQPEQYTIPGLVQETLAQIEFEYELASRWHPIGTGVPIVVDPRISGGLPTVEGRGITVQAIHKRFKAKQKIDFIARDFALARGVVEEVIRYAEQVAV